VRHTIVDHWSTRSSPLHACDPRAKLLVLLVLLIAISTTPSAAQLTFAAYAAVLFAASVSSRLPVTGLALRAALVLPFSATFAIITWWSGDPIRALALAEKSYLSGFATLLLIATTPLPAWTAALAAWHCPRSFLLILQFLYRYLFVIAGQAHRMRIAAKCRGGATPAAAIGVLFARSWERAEGVARAMFSRGFRGEFSIAPLQPFRPADAVFLMAGLAASIVIRIAA
jgi:cobalt/nickel transport system permease protein